MKMLTPQEIEPGMIVAESIRTPNGQELAPIGTVITRQLINRMRLYRIEKAAVAMPNESLMPAPVPAPAPQPAPSQEKLVAKAKEVFHTQVEENKTAKQKVAESQEFQDFQLQYIRAIEEMKVAFNATVNEGAPLDAAGLLESIADLFRSRNTIIEMFDMLNNMRSVTDSVYAHCLNVALVSRMIGRWLRFTKENLDVLTLAGLFHDIGKLKIPEEILNKPGSLTDEEFAMIKSHPRLGYDILKTQDLDPRIKKAALMHHERCDGSGYPSGLEEELIDEYAMIVGIADVYDAMTAARSYRQPLCAFQVIALFEEDGFAKYQTKYLLTFLRQIAITYQNNRVILNDGRGGKIVMLNPNDLSRPVIQFDDKSCIDLSANRQLKITAIV